ncbi:MAG: hypothetical protein U0T74_08740 [Chitinophagales bacterium]
MEYIWLSFSIMLKNLILFSLVCFINLLPAREPSDSLKSENRIAWRKESSNKGSLYIQWGYNREYFSRSSIHFKGADYDLTFYNITAHDRPSKFTFNTYFNPVNISIPQYCFRAGYFVTGRLHFSLGIDHLKYVMDANQRAVLSGVINPAVSAKYGGSYLHDTVVVSSDLLRFEHTNGLNLVSLDVGYLLPCLNIYKKKVWLKWNFGLGGFFVITKTDVTILNDRTDNKFHLSGYCIAAHTGPRFEFWKWGFVGFEVKGGYIGLPDVLIHNEQPIRANHDFGFFEYYGLVGFQIPIPEIIREIKETRQSRFRKNQG